MIKTLDHLPDNILQAPAQELHRFVGNHTLIKLSGRIERPVFISVLQHGDERTGWEAVKAYLKIHAGRLPRSLYLLFGNIEAARYNLRQLNNQPDFNRCWPGHNIEQNAVSEILAEITEMMREVQPFASVDIHNNSGRNPHYAGINKLDQRFVNLGSMFSETIIFFTSPDGIQSGAFASICPSVTIECGMSETADGIEQTHTFLEMLMSQSSLDDIPGVALNQQVLNIFSTVKVREDVSIGFADDDVDFALAEDLDYLNFHCLEPGTAFGQFNAREEMPFVVTDQKGNDITDDYFDVRDRQVVTKQAVIPAMITQSIAAIRMDCLCYLMQNMPNQHGIQQHEHL